MSNSWYESFFSPSHEFQQDIVRNRAEKGDADAQFALGFGCASEGSAENFQSAARWYLMAAGQDHALAQFNLGIMCANGQGMAEDKVKARSWFTKAARLGDAGAQHQLGMDSYRSSLHGSVELAQESRIEAYKWFRLAAEQDYRGSTGAYEQLALRMTRDDVMEANDRVAVFLRLKE